MAQETWEVPLLGDDDEASWADWAEAVLADAEAAEAVAIHIDFQERSPVPIGLIGIIRRLVAEWSRGDERRVRLVGLDPELRAGLAFLGMCESEGPPLPISGSLASDGSIIILFEAQDEGYQALLRPEAIRWLDGLQVDELVVDLRKLDQVGSNVLNWLLNVQSRVPQVSLRHGTGRVVSVLKQMRLDRLFEIQRNPVIHS